MGRCERDAERDGGARAPRVYRGANREGLGRQPAARHGTGGGGGGHPPETGVGELSLTFATVSSEEGLQAVYPLMRQLRDRITPETFAPEVRAQQAQGYELVAGFDAGAPVVLAGIRRAHTLSRGAHLFVDDLVTAEP